MLFQASLAIFSLFGQPQTGCSIDRAIYRDTANADFTVSFMTIDVRNRMVVRSGQTAKTYSFFMDEGNGYSTMTLTPVDVVSGRSVRPIFAYAIREDLDASGEFPSASDPAPLYIFVPELGRLLWYQAESLGGPSLASGPREDLPRVFFKLSSCRP